MASRPSNAPSPRTLMTLGLFVFGMDTLAYNQLQRKMSWRHGKSERHAALPATQFLGPGEDTISIEGMLVPEVQGSYTAITRLIEMADSGDNWPLTDGDGNVWGNFEIQNIDQRHRAIMAGGKPRIVDFGIDLNRVS
jgi:uncharacterized protein